MKLLFTFAMLAAVSHGHIAESSFFVGAATANTAMTNSKQEIELTVTNNDGLGESPGIPGMNFLGRGYDIFFGNPRGSFGNEVDPGFRSAIVQFTDSQDGPLTRDKSFLVPNGVEVNGATSCTFESTSVEVSTSQQLREQLNKESSYSNEVNAEFQSNYRFPVQISASVAWSGSEKFQSFSESVQKEQITSYEAKAQCNVFDISFQPFVEPDLKTTFVDAVSDLPSTFCPFDPENRNKFYRFMDAFGTHVVAKVTLGAKSVLSTTMKSTDALELKRNQVDISNSLSISIQAKLGNKVNQEDDFFSAPSPSPNSQTLTIVVTDEKPDGCEASCDAPAGTVAESIGATFGAKINSDSSSSSSRENLEEISTRVQTVTVTNVGGNAYNDDNDAFAESARTRPMPVKTELRGIWQYFEQIDRTFEMKAKAFLQAFLVRRGVDLNEDADGEDNSLLRALHFGTYRTNSSPIITTTTDSSKDPPEVKEEGSIVYDAFPISSYSLAANDNYRTSIELQYSEQEGTPMGVEKKCIYDEEFDDDEINQKVCANGDGFDSGTNDGVFRGLKTCSENYFVCGLAAVYDNRSSGDYGLLQLTMECCPFGYTTFSQSESVPLYGNFLDTNSGDRSTATKRCKRREFITTIRVAADFSGNARGIVELDMICQTGGLIRLFKVEDDDDITADSRITTTGSPNSALTGINPSFDTTVDSQGYVNMELHFQQLELSSPKSTLFYTSVWEGSSTQVSAFFVTMIHNKIGKSQREDDQLQFFDDEIVLSGAYHPFGILSLSDPSVASFAFVDYDAIDVVDFIPSFGFLAADNLPDNPLYEEKIVAGVVHPDLYVLNEVFGKDNGFTIEEGNAGSDSTLAKLTFAKADGWASFVVMPLWLNSERQPGSIREVSVSIGSQDENGATFNLGGASQFTSDSLGMMFLSLRNLPDAVKGIVHGNFVDYGSSSANTECFRCDFEVKSLANYGKSVLIKFDKESIFEAPPSVIVTPVQHSNNGRIPVAVVEYVTRSEALVKVFEYDIGGTVDPTNLPFNFIAAGPPMQKKSTELSNENLCI